VRQTNTDLAGITLADDAPAVSERIKRLLVPARPTDIIEQMVRNGEPALKSVYDVMQAAGWTTNQLTVKKGLIVLTVGRGPAACSLSALETLEARRSITWTLAAQANGETKFRDLTGFSAEQIASDALTQLY